SNISKSITATWQTKSISRRTQWPPLPQRLSMAVLFSWPEQDRHVVCF
ncbi:hypothetical protein GCK32_021025, partial [Trichostrongylus colubriformis]